MRYIGKSVIRRISLISVAAVTVAGGGAALAQVVTGDPVTSPSFDGPFYAVAYQGDTV